MKGGGKGDSLSIKFDDALPGLPRLNPDEIPVLNEVLLRPVGAFLTFDAYFEQIANSRVGEPVLLDTQGRKLYRNKQGLKQPGQTSVVIQIDRRLIASASVVSAGKTVNWKNQSGITRVFSRLSDAYEMTYALPTRHLGQIERIDEAMRRVLTQQMINNANAKE